MDVAVAIPCFNSAKTIKETIDDVLKQSFRDFELIVYDDGSTDNTAEIVHNISKDESRVRLYLGEKNRGRSAARNAAVAIAGNRLIAWQDADDLWHKEKLERQVAYYAKASDVFCDDKIIITSPIKKIPPRGKSENDATEFSYLYTSLYPPTVYDLDYIYSKDFTNCPFFLTTTLGPAEYYAHCGGFDEELAWHEDLDIALKLTTSGYRIVGHRYHEALSYYYLSVPKTNSKVLEEALDFVTDKYAFFAKARGINVNEYRIWRRHSYLFQTLVRKGDVHSALNLVITDLQQAPLSKATIDQIRENLNKLCSRNER
ncbi:glycosyltransferase family 2 protein [Agrobacterium sp. NPDC090283]|uniref:glycosyltransferase family 2 protein n=1 Tax=Agrobacterium sp. NPDC090283 TaxID=3363920 RepID=UPI00383A2450